MAMAQNPDFGGKENGEEVVDTDAKGDGRSSRRVLMEMDPWS